MAIVNRVPELVAAKFGGDPENINLLKVQRETNLTYTAVSRWVKGYVTRIDTDALETWCKYLKVQPGDILQYVPDQD